jgi:DNA-directed RNA polymerase subunit RPC12/RpoP/flagellar basal body-associated protein FliL
MKARVIVPLIIGILLIVAGLAFLAFYGIGSSNSTLNDERNVGSDQVWILGGKMASRITGEYSASQPVNVYVTTDDSVMGGFIMSIQSLDDVDTIALDSRQGDIDYETGDSSLDYYLLIENPNDTTTNVDLSVVFESDVASTICLIPGIIFLIIGIVLIIVAVMARKKAAAEPAQYPPQMQQQQYYAQPPQQQYAPRQQYTQQPPQQYAQPPPPVRSPPPPRKTASYDCPLCRRPFTMQVPSQDTVVTCPSCKQRITIGPV